MPHCPASSAAPHGQARMTSGLPRPAIFGSANCAPASASSFISGSGLISLLSGMKPETMVPRSNGKRKLPRRNRLGRGLAQISRQGIAPRRGVAAEFGLFDRRCRIHANSVILRCERSEPRTDEPPGLSPFEARPSAEHLRVTATRLVRGLWKEKSAEPRRPLEQRSRVPYTCRWAPCDRTHELGQGQLPKRSIRPRELAPDAPGSPA